MCSVSVYIFLQPTREVSHSSLLPLTRFPMVMWKYVFPLLQLEILVKGWVVRISCQNIGRPKLHCSFWITGYNTIFKIICLQVNAPFEISKSYKSYNISLLGAGWGDKCEVCRHKPSSLGQWDWLHVCWWRSAGSQECWALWFAEHKWKSINVSCLYTIMWGSSKTCLRKEKGWCKGMTFRIWDEQMRHVSTRVILFFSKGLWWNIDDGAGVGRKNARKINSICKELHMRWQVCLP